MKQADGLILAIGQFTTSQIVVIAGTGALGFLLLALVGREIYFAANPDKRPLKRKRRK